ncbi:response regulator transcription factor [Maribacter sp. 2210JD10-5]|uniref:response regulator transcription factor n=1 Tax=Maribacter sp. 2210JD10-5 TaxID=3386272 RepID=UPI0039BC7D1E
MKKVNYIGIVDDDPITVFGIRKMLNLLVKCDSIDSFANGKLALDSIVQKIENKETLPEVIFLDINMPIMDGWQFLEAFIKLPIKEKIRINVVTSSIDTHDRQKWEFFKDKTHHLITFNNKPIQKQEIENITKVA